MWRDTGLVPQVIVIDYHACAPLLVYCLNILDMTLLKIALGTVLFLGMMKIWQITPMILLRIIRTKITYEYRTTHTNYLTVRRRVRW